MAKLQTKQGQQSRRPAGQVRRNGADKPPGQGQGRSDETAQTKPHPKAHKEAGRQGTARRPASRGRAIHQTAHAHQPSHTQTKQRKVMEMNDTQSKRRRVMHDEFTSTVDGRSRASSRRIIRFPLAQFTGWPFCLKDVQQARWNLCMRLRLMKP